jgi:hypothetical protein
MAKDGHDITQELLLNRTEASHYLIEKWRVRCSIAMLAKLAVVGGGPEFRKAGRTPLYPQDGLDSYAQSIMSRRVRSTSELTVSKSDQLEATAA